MGNEIQKSGPAELNPNITEYNQQAEKIVNVGKTESVTTGPITYNIYGGSVGRRTQVASGTFGTSHDYYSIFVQGTDDFLEKEYFYVDKDRALNSGLTSDSIRNKVNALEPDAIEQVKTFPAIFCSENHQYGKTDDDQKAYYGIVYDIKVQDNGIKIYYQILNEITQQTLNEHLFELALSGNDRFNELNRTHWAIKKVDLVTTLHEIGIRVLAY